MEIEEEVKTVLVDYICNFMQPDGGKCTGKMRPFGGAILTNPPKYQHRCNKCGRSDVFTKSYPYITHKPITI